MAIFTLQGVKEGLRPPTSFYISNTSGVGANLLATEMFFNTNSTTAGGIAITSPTNFSGTDTSFINSLRMLPSNPIPGQSTYLAGVTGKGYRVGGTFGSSIILFDTLWMTGAISTGSPILVDASLQTINSIAWPPRDNNSTINGEGVYIGIVLNNSFGTTGDTSSTITYTNSLGISNRTGISQGHSGLDSAFNFFSLEPGDTGVQSIQSFQFTANHVSGAIRLVAIRPIAILPMLTGNLTKVDAVSLCFPKLWDNSMIGAVQLRVTSTDMSFTLHLTQG